MTDMYYFRDWSGAWRVGRVPEFKDRLAIADGRTYGVRFRELYLPPNEDDSFIPANKLKPYYGDNQPEGK